MTIILKSKLFSVKKIPYNLLVAFLTIGASLILGFLSFSGMFVLIPLLPVAFAAFGLSVAYEGEIYLQNIKGAIKKLFKRNYLENHLAKEYLLTKFPEKIQDKDCPQFFRDYALQLELLDAFGDEQLNQASAQRKKRVEKNLIDMEKWFAIQLFTPLTTNLQSDYARDLGLWLANPKQEQKEWQERLKKRQFTFKGLKIFSGLAGAFMTLGTSYLIVEAFSVIPFIAGVSFALWPIFIVPMAIVAGVAYGMLTYNAMTDFVNNDTIKKWYYKFKENWQKGFSWHNVIMTGIAVVLIAITVALTICTAGTWWTVASNARPLFTWMKNMPKFIMGVINPIIIGLSAVSFNFQNMAETLVLVDDGVRGYKGDWLEKLEESIVKAYKHLRRTENLLQMLNPFRIILKLTIAPLRILFFLGHLVSVGVTADRMPGVPEIVAALIAIISEGFEDAHYFVGDIHSAHEHDAAPKPRREFKTILKEHLEGGHNHNHSVDIPTRILKALASPIYLLATCWDYLTSQLNSHQYQIAYPKDAWNKQRGIKEEEVNPDAKAKQTSLDWKKERVISLIEKYKTKHLTGTIISSKVASEKVLALDAFKQKVEITKDLATTLKEESKQSVYNKNRWFNLSNETTATRAFIDELPGRVIGSYSA